jgi:hypothetical protein
MANDDVNPTPVNGYTGGVAVSNVLDNDTFDGGPIDLADYTITTPAAGSIPSGVSFNTATGEVSVAAGTAADSVSFYYQVCQNADPTNCDSALVTFVIGAAPLDAVADVSGNVSGYDGGTAISNVLANDTFNGSAINPAEVTLSLPVGVTVPTGLVFNTLTGSVTVLAGTPAGNYTFHYEICEILNPTNCDTALVSVTVTAAPLDGVADVSGEINGYDGGPAIMDVRDNDTLNGVVVDPTEVTLSVPVGVTVPTGIVFDTITGSVTVTAGTAAGDYTFYYEICEILNPTNCDTALVSVTVTAAPLDGVADVSGEINGYDGGSRLNK